MSWMDKRRQIREDMAEVFSSYTSISRDNFLSRFYDPGDPPTIGDFDNHFIPDRSTEEQILSALARELSLDEEKVESHYHREETFPQFGEHLLRIGAYPV